MSRILRGTAAGGVLAALTGGGYVVSEMMNPYTEVVLWDMRDYTSPGVIDDRACSDCLFEEGATCECTGEPITCACVSQPGIGAEIVSPDEDATINELKEEKDH